MDDLLNEFLVESAENIDAIDLELVEFEKDPSDKTVLENIFRMVHTIKGTCGFVGLARLEAVTHATENVLGKFRDGKLAVTPDAVSQVLAGIDRIKEILQALEETGVEPDGDDSGLLARLEDAGAATTSDTQPVAPVEAPNTAADTEQSAPAQAAADAARPDASIRIGVDLLDELMDMVGELVLTRNQLAQLVRTSDDGEFAGPVQRLNKCTTALQQSVLKSRMQPIGHAWAKLPRLVRDLSVGLGKEINLDMRGEDTEIDRQILEAVRDPLTHLVRNACDHGIETPAERAADCKDTVGTLRLEARHEGGYAIISISDDGRGIDVDTLRAKALERQIVDESRLQRMNDDEIRRLIFHAGFSTAGEVTNLSGRGVGLDVVRNNIEHIGGTVELTSSKGEGTCFTIRIPLTLAIIKALVVEGAGETFAIPQINIRELVSVGSDGNYPIEMIDNAPFLQFRGGLVPVVFLDALMDNRKAPAAQQRRPGDQFAIIAQAGARGFALVADRLLDSQEIVVKPLAPVLKDVGLYAGATILGNGKVILILDPNGIADEALDVGVSAKSAELSAATEDDAKPAAQESFLVFRAGPLPLRAVPLAKILRLETFEAANFEHTDCGATIRYHGEQMPVVGIAPSVKVADGNPRQPVIVFANGGEPVGLAVDEIVDIIPDHVEIDHATAQTGTLGTARIGARLADIIDIAHYVELAGGQGNDMARSGDVAEAQASVLLIEDSPYFRNMLHPQLSAAGYEVRCVETADQALELRDAGEKFDLIISNLEMPGMNGFEFASHIRQAGAWTDVPMVALSTLVSEADAARGRAVGYSDYVAKFDRHALIECVSAQLRRKGDAA